MTHNIKSIRLTFLTFLCLFFTTPTFAELNAYMTITGVNQGTIHGDVTQAGREDTFEVNEFHHLLKYNSGLNHEPVILLTRMSKSFPLLLQALKDDESLTVKIEFYRPTNTGQEERYMTYDLLDARLVVAEPVSYNNKIPENISLRASVRLRFNYQNLQVTYNPDGQVVLLPVQ